MYVLSKKQRKKRVPFLEGFYISRDGSDDPVIYHDLFFLTAWIVWNLANHKGELCQQITCDIMAKPSAGLLWKWWYSMFQNCQETMGIDGRDGLQKSLVFTVIYPLNVRLSRMSSLHPFLGNISLKYVEITDLQMTCRWSAFCVCKLSMKIWWRFDEPGACNPCNPCPTLSMSHSLHRQRTFERLIVNDMQYFLGFA